MATSKMLDMQKETERMWIDSRCMICHENQKDVLIIDCKHTCICRVCIKGTKRCPDCFTRVKSYINLSFRKPHSIDPLVKIRKDTYDLWKKQVCKACGKEKRKYIILDCRHLCLCKTCLASCVFCPVCNGDITKTMEVFY